MLNGYQKKRTGILAGTLLFLLAAVTSVHAQEDYMDLSLDALMDIEIIETITKKPEVLFEAPLSVSVLKQEEILQSGATSIPEALRLVPGLIVREQTPGVYDVHIRGFDGATTTSMLPFPSNSITLVMIDYRVVYNYFAGGTFWETLPVGIHDIDRIEVIRGPSSSLYGPNAVAGVINIVTNRAKTPGWYVNSGAQIGNKDTIIGDMAFGYNHEDKWSGTISVNYQNRNRHQSDYYSWVDRDYVPVQDLSSTLTPDDPLDSIGQRYPNPERSLRKYGLNGFFSLNLAKNAKIDLSAGHQKSDVQKIYVNNFATPLTNNDSETTYVDLKAKVGNTGAQVSFITGEQQTSGMADWKYDLRVVDAVLEHDFQWKNLSVRPGFSFRYANYDGQFIGGSQDLTNYAFSLLADFHATDKLRFLGSARLDLYNSPSDPYFSFQLFGTYRINVNNIVRVGASRANRAPFMLDTYIDHAIPLELAEIRYLGNDDLDLMTVHTFEAGWRTKIADGLLAMDIEAFFSILDSFSDLLFSGTETQGNDLLINYRYANFDLRAKQYGATLSVDLTPIDPVFFRVYTTYQKTEFSSDWNTLSAVTDKEIPSTPEFVGGAVLNVTPLDGLNLNLNTYYTTSQTYAGLVGTDEIPSRVVFNGKVSYAVLDNTRVFVNARNILSGGEKEYGFADEIERLYLVGLEITQ